VVETKNTSIQEYKEIKRKADEFSNIHRIRKASFEPSASVPVRGNEADATFLRR
jgi:hypothetical protein